MQYKQWIKNLLSDRSKWAYYSGLTDDSFEEILNNPRDFIRHYLREGDKLPPEIDTIINTYFPNSKAFHTVSIFLFGILIYENITQIKKSIDKYITTYKKGNVDLSFPYFWFQICFYHDIWSSLEINNDENSKEMLDTLTINLHLPNTIDIISKLNQETNVIPEEIKKTWYQYFKMRKNEKNVEDDHGFVAGALYYYYRKTGYERMKKKSNIIKTDINTFFDPIKQLQWSEDLLYTLHQDIAWCIIAHNVWYAEVRGNNYLKYRGKLNDLIIEKPVFDILTYPLYSLLVLVDTFDFYKIYMNLTKSSNDRKLLETIFEDIEVQVSEGELQFIFSTKLESLKNEIHNRLVNNQYWLSDLNKCIRFV